MLQSCVFHFKGLPTLKVMLRLSEMGVFLDQDEVKWITKLNSNIKRVSPEFQLFDTGLVATFLSLGFPVHKRGQCRLLS